MPRSFCLLVFVVLLGGCAAMTESECQYADWHRLGERDARQGRPASYFAERAAACQEHGLAADRRAYQQGWQQGLEHFCTPGAGFRHGLHGDSYRDICPHHSERAFLAGYELGLDIHQAREHLDSLDRRVVSLEAELEELDDPDSDEADAIRDEIRDRRYEIRALERELGGLEVLASERGYPLDRY